MNNKLLTFEDLVFKEHPLAKQIRESDIIDDSITSQLSQVDELLDAKQAIIAFPNGITLSVLFGSSFYSNGIDTYEAMEVKSDKQDCEPEAYLTKEEVTEYMKELQS